MNCNLSPFKGWCIENFPFIEDDFNAITDYQLMCKLKEYVVNIGNDVANLETNYNELIDKVNDLEIVINGMSEEFAEIKLEFASLKTLVESYNMRIVANSNRIEQVNVSLLNTISMTADDLREYADTKVANLKTYVDEQDSYILTQIANLKTYVDSQDSYILTQVENIYGALPKARFTGTSIEAQNTIEAPMPMKLNSNTLTQATTTGANLQKFNARTNTYEGETYTCDDKGQVTITGTMNANKNITYGYNIVATNPMTLTAGTYTIKLVGTKGSNVSIYREGNNLLSFDSDNETTFTLDSDTSTFNLSIYVTSGAHNDNFYLTLASGTTATTERYTGGIPAPNPNYPMPVHRITGNNTLTINGDDVVIPLGDIEYCKIGDYADTIFKAVDGDPVYDTLTSEVKATLTSNKWYIQKNVGKVVLDGSEDESYAVVYGSIYNHKLLYNINNISHNNSNYELIKCNRLKARAGETEYYDEGINCTVSSSYLRLILSDTTLSTYTVTALITWLSTHNLIAYFVLSTPTYIPLNDTLQEVIEDVYNNQKSNNGTTTITQTNADLPFIIEAIVIKKGEITDEV